MAVGHLVEGLKNRKEFDVYASGLRRGFEVSDHLYLANW